MIKNKSNIYIYALLLIGTLLPYSNALHSGFTWDDFSLIEKDERIKGIENIPLIFSSDFWPNNEALDEKLGYYRPIVTVSYLIDYSLWKLRPIGYHFSNILFHLMTTLLVYLISSKIFKNNRMAFYTSLLFAVHPIHTEAVTPIWGRTDLLCGLFYFASIFMYLSSQKKYILYLISLLFFFMALLSKEMAISLPLVIIGYDYIMKKDSSNAHLYWWRYLGFIGVVIIYLGARYYAIDALVVNRHSEVFSLPQKLCLMTASISFYLKSFYLPLKLNAYPVFGISKCGILFFKAIAVIAVFASIATLLYRKKENLIGLVFAAMAIIPVLLPGAVGGVMAAERFLYIPSAGLCLFTIQAISNTSLIRMSGKLKSSIAVAILLLISIRTYVRNFDWKDDFSITVKTVEMSPEAVFPRLNLADHYERLLKHQEAISQYYKTINYMPDDITAYFKLAHLYVLMGVRDSGIVYYNKVIELDPTRALAYNNLANIYFVERNYALALYYFKQAQQFDGSKTIVDSYSLGQAYLFEGRPDSAITYLSRFTQTTPNIAHCYLLLGYAYIMHGDRQPAIASWNKYIEISKDLAMVKKIKKDIKKIQ